MAANHTMPRCGYPLQGARAAPEPDEATSDWSWRCGGFRASRPVQRQLQGNLRRNSGVDAAAQAIQGR
jgi:hypothetical protein